MLAQGHYLVTFKHIQCLLLIALLVKFSPMANAFRGGGGDYVSYHHDLYSAEGEATRLFEHVVNLTESESEEHFCLVN